MTKLGKFCLYTPIKVFLISLILSSIIFMIGMSQPSSNQHGCDMSGITYSFIMFLNALASIFSYTIVFNFYKLFRDNSPLSFITFYWPVLFIAFFSISLVYQSFLLTLVAFFPFLIPQTYYYIRFRKRLRSGEIIDDFYEEWLN